MQTRSIRLAMRVGVLATETTYSVYLIKYFTPFYGLSQLFISFADSCFQMPTHLRPSLVFANQENVEQMSVCPFQRRGNSDSNKLVPFLKSHSYRAEDLGPEFCSCNPQMAAFLLTSCNGFGEHQILGLHIHNPLGDRVSDIFPKERQRNAAKVYMNKIEQCFSQNDSEPFKPYCFVPTDRLLTTYITIPLIFRKREM